MRLITRCYPTGGVQLMLKIFKLERILWLLLSLSGILLPSVSWAQTSPEPTPSPPTPFPVEESLSNLSPYEATPEPSPESLQPTLPDAELDPVSKPTPQTAIQAPIPSPIQPSTSQPTDPQPTDPQPTNPQPTNPQPTNPQPTDPQPLTVQDPASSTHVEGDSNSDAGRIIGQVFNELGQPVSAAEIQLMPVKNPDDGDTLDQGEDPEEGGDPLFMTDARGGFELSTITEGQWQLIISHPEYERLVTSIWIQDGFTTPVDVVLETPLVKQPRTRLGVLGVGGLDHTQELGQRLATEAVRQGLVPRRDDVVPLDNRRLRPVLKKVGHPLYELFEWDRRRPEAVSEFFDYLGLESIVISRVDVLSRPSSPTEIELKSRSRLELWRLDPEGNLQVDVLAEASRSATEINDLNSSEVAQLYQIQVTQMAEEVGSRWQEASPLASYVELDPPSSTPSSDGSPASTLDTTVELRIPETASIPEPEDPVGDPTPEPTPESTPIPEPDPTAPSVDPEPATRVSEYGRD